MNKQKLTVETRTMEQFRAAGYEDFWTHRVRLTPRQAVVAFTKFSTMGIGFLTEDSARNLDLPWTCPAEEIFRHIACNKGDDTLSDEDCLAAIRLLQDALRLQGHDEDWRDRGHDRAAKRFSRLLPAWMYDTVTGQFREELNRRGHQLPEDKG